MLGWVEELWSDLNVIRVGEIDFTESFHELIEICVEFCLKRVVLLGTILVKCVLGQFNAI